MSKRRKRGRCRKVCHATRERAELVVDRSYRARCNGNSKRNERNVYFCVQCVAWHTTSDPVRWFKPFRLPHRRP